MKSTVRDNETGLLRLDSQDRYHIGIFIASIILFVFILIHLHVYPSIVDRADAWAYQQYGISFREHGILRNFGTFRTYGYAFFLYLLTYPFGTSPHRLALATSIVQYIIFFAATRALSRAVYKTDPLLGTAVTIGLLLNPFVISLVSDNLTEGLSIGIYVWLFYVIIMLGRASSLYTFASLASIGWLLSAFSIEIRPANVSILAGWCMAMAWTLCTIKPNDEVWRKRLSIVVFTSPIVILPLLPQMLYNLTNYQSLSPMPVCSLGEFQIQYGILAMKYDTVIHGVSAAGYNYPNPLFHGNIEDGRHWYVSHPLAGMGTMLLHLINVLTVTDIFTYIRSEKSASEIITATFYSAVYIAGGYYASVASSSLMHRFRSRSWSDQPTIIYLVTSQILTLLICAVSAVELRFGVFACGLLSISAALLTLRIIKGEIVINRKLFIAFALALALNITICCLVISFGSEEPVGQKLNFDFIAHRCMM